MMIALEAPVPELNRLRSWRVEASLYYLLDGSLQFVGNRVRVTLRLLT